MSAAIRPTAIMSSPAVQQNIVCLLKALFVLSSQTIVMQLQIVKSGQVLIDAQDQAIALSSVPRRIPERKQAVGIEVPADI